MYRAKFVQVGWAASAVNAEAFTESQFVSVHLNLHQVGVVRPKQVGLNGKTRVERCH